jgi:osmoprotectant transport system substrate-binding protein
MPRTLRLLLTLLATVALVAAGCGDDDDGGVETADTQADVPSGPTIAIGAQDFSESAILAEIYKQSLEDAGYEVGIQTLGGFRDIEIAAFDSDEINFAPEYAASLLEFLNEQAGEATADAGRTVEKLQPYLEDKGLTALEPSEAADQNTFVVTPETSDEVGLETLTDLAENGQDLSLGGPADCETNAYCIPGLQRVYSLDLSGNFTALDPGAVADALEAGEVDVGLLFTTNPRIEDEGWVQLEDDKEMLAADNIVPVVKGELVDAYGADFESLVNDLSAALTTEELTDLNRRVDIDKEDAVDVAADWLAENA